MADDIAVLGIQIDSKDVKIAARDLVNLVDAAKKAGTETQALERKMDALTREVRNIAGGFSNLRNIVIGLGLAAAAREIIQVADAWTLTNARLRLVTASTQELANVQQRLFQIAQTTKSEYSATAELYTRMARNANALGLSTEQMLRVNDLFIKSLKISGTSAAESESVIRQFSQSLTKGKVTGDEFNSMLENAGGMLDLVAKGLGTTTQRLVLMGKEGDLTTQMIINGLTRAGGLIDKQFSSIPTTVGDSIQFVKNAFGQYINEINTSTGATSELAEKIMSIADVFKRPEFIEGGIRFAEDFAAGMERLADVAPTVVDAVTTMGSAVGTIMDGYMQLPDEVRTYGLIGAVLFGAKGISVLAGTGAAMSSGDEIKKRWFDLGGLQDSDRPLTDMLTNFINFYRAVGGGIADAFSGDNKRAIDEVDAATFRYLKTLSRFKVEDDGIGWLNDQTKDLTKNNVDLTRSVGLTKEAFKAWVDTQDKAISASLKSQAVMRNLRQEVEILSVRVTQGDAAAERLELEIRLREQLGSAYAENAEAIKALIAERDRLLIGMEAHERFLEQERQTADAWLEIWRNTAQGIQNAIAQALGSIFGGGGNFLSNLANVGRQAFGQIATQAMFGNTLTSLQGIGRSGGGSMVGTLMGGGSFAAAANGLMQPLFPSMAWSGPGQTMFGNVAGQLNPANIGAGIAGSMLSSALFKPRQGLGNEIGGTIGGTAGMVVGNMILPGIGGTIGSFLGSFLGSTVGGMFGPKASDMLEGGVLNFGTGGIREWDLGPGKDSPQNRNAANSIFGAASGFNQHVRNAGGRLSASEVAVDIGNRTGINLTVDGTQRMSAATPDDAIRMLIDHLKAGIEGVGPIVQQAFQTIDLLAPNAAELLQFAQSVEQFMNENADTSGVSGLQQQFNVLDDQLETFKLNLVAIGQSADLATPLIQKMKDELIDGFVKGLDQTLNNLRGHGFLNEISGIITQVDDLRANATTAGVGMASIDEIFNLSIKNVVQGIIDGAGSLAQAQPNLAVLRTTFAAFPDVIAAIDLAMGNITDPAAIAAAKAAADATKKAAEEAQRATERAAAEALRAQEEAERRVRQMRIDTINLEIQGLREVQATLNNRISGLKGVISGSGDALLRIATDPGFGNTPGDSLGTLRALWTQTQTAAAGGDIDAMAKLPEIGLSLLQASREMSASTDAFFADRAMVTAVLRDQKSLAQRELEVAEATLAANIQQVALLSQQVQNIQRNGSAAGGATFTGNDLDALERMFGTDLAASGNPAAFANSGLFQGYERDLFTMIGGTSDVSRLLTDLGEARAQMSDPIFGGSASRRATVISERLAELGLPGREIGGTAGQAFRAHPNEVVFFGNNAQVLTAAQAAGAVERGVQGNDRMEQAYRIGTQATHAALRELIEESRENRKELRAIRRELGRVKEKVGVE